MNLARSLRKRLVRRPARAPEIVAAFVSLLGRPPTTAEVAGWERRWVSPARLRLRIARSNEARERAPDASAVAAPDPRHLPPVEPGPAAPGIFTPVAPQPVARKPVAERAVDAAPLMAHLSDEEFVRVLYERVMERHPSPAELAVVAGQLRAGDVSRAVLLASRFASRVEEEAAWADDGAVNDVERFPVMGTGQTMSSAEWHALARADGRPEAVARSQSRFPLRPRASDVDVSVICSLWRGGDFIERYLENITSQSIFEDRCELIVIDAASPEGEGEAVARYAKRLGHRVVYHRLPYRAGIYVAWNVAVGLARGRYLTNANLDDLRRVDSLELQATTLDALPHVDVVYQDHLYCADPEADFDRIAEVGVASDLPLVTRSGFFYMNPPHNAPMWRAALHDRIGLFDERLRSAGDYDLWIRAAIAGAGFYKINDPHVGYYYNPEGISTSRQTLGLREGRDALRRHGRALTPEAAIEAPDAFLARLGLAAWPDRADGLPLSRYALVQRRMRDLAVTYGPARKVAQP